MQKLKPIEWEYRCKYYIYLNIVGVGRSIKESGCSILEGVGL